MLRPRRQPYRPHSAASSRLESRKIHVGFVPARGLNAPAVSISGPWTAKNFFERNLFLHEAIELRDKLDDVISSHQKSGE